jgi:hypothetical protein
MKKSGVFFDVVDKRVRVEGDGRSWTDLID